MDGAAAPLNGQAAQPNLPDVRKAWQPLKLLARFRARVSALTRRDEALPVQVDAIENNPAVATTGGIDSSPRSYACDVVYICPDATPADVLIRQRIASSDSMAERNALAEVHQRLRAIYSVGGLVPHRFHIRRMVHDSLNGEASDRVSSLVEFAAGPLNDALCREQALAWLSQTDVRMHLYGRGWEHHADFRPFVRSFKDGGSDNELLAISQTAPINLRLTRTDVTDPILSSGIRAGAFFLMRFFPEDVIERIYRPLYAFCMEHEITSDDQLRAGATNLVRRLIAFADRTLGLNVFELPGGFVPALRRRGDDGFARWPGSLWNGEYDAVSFGSREQLITLTRRYLEDAPERRRIAGAMRRTWVERQQMLEQQQEYRGSKRTAGAEAPGPARALAATGEVAA